MPDRDNDTIDTLSIAYEQMAPSWQIIHDLSGGTRAMRAAGERWLPKEPAESSQAYSSRVNRSFLFNAFSNTVERIKGMPFSSPVVINGEIADERLEKLEKDVDKTRRSLTALSCELFGSGLEYGFTHVLIDYPSMERGATLAVEREADARPCFIEITPPDMIGWDSITLPDGTKELTRIRFKREAVRRVGMYKEEAFDQIWVWTSPRFEQERQAQALMAAARDRFEANLVGQQETEDDDGSVRPFEPSPELLEEINQVLSETDINNMPEGVIEVWERSREEEDSEYQMIEYRNHSYKGIPLVTFYTKRTGYMTGEPPLRDLADKNVEYWQSSSDQRNILRFTRFAMVFFSGLSDDEISKPMEVGPNRFFRAKDPQASMKFVEHTGSAIKSGEDDLHRIKEEMQVLGMIPLIRRSGGVTATERAIDEGARRSDAERWVETLEDALVEMYKIAAIWLDVELPDDFTIDINDDFGFDLREGGEIEQLFKMWEGGAISHTTLLEELKTRNVLSELLDIDSEIRSIEQSPPPNSREEVTPDEIDPPNDDPEE